MRPIYKTDESFRDEFRFANSEEAILRFPFPFVEDKYMYSVNIEPHVPSGLNNAFSAAFDVDEHYVAECRERSMVLKQDPSRCIVLPHMMAAQWDTLELIMENLSKDYPEDFELSRDGNRWTWINHPLGINDVFTFGDPKSLPQEPFEYITRQAQGDFTLQDQRDDNLFVDGGMVTTQADWSLEFNVGMTFHEWHGPVPIAHDLGIFDRALQYLMRMQYGRPVRRLNWTMTVNPRLDTSPENYPIWGPDRATIVSNNVGEKLHLRVELQTLFRLPRSNAILFGVRAYLASIDELVRVPKWGRRLHRVLRDLHPDLAAYKGLVRYRETAINYLTEFDDGEETSLGIAPETLALRPSRRPADT
jgi:dimethylamine monooxygenase subunit A